MKNNNPNTRYCPSCGEKLQLGETHCEYCGATYVEKPKPVIESKRIITGFPTKKSKRYLIGMILVMEVIIPLVFLISGIFSVGLVFGISFAIFFATFGEINRRILMGPTVEFFDDGTFTISFDRNVKNIENLKTVKINDFDTVAESSKKYFAVFSAVNVICLVIMGVIWFWI